MCYFVNYYKSVSQAGSLEAKSNLKYILPSSYSNGQFFISKSQVNRESKAEEYILICYCAWTRVTSVYTN